LTSGCHNYFSYRVGQVVTQLPDSCGRDWLRPRFFRSWPYRNRARSRAPRRTSRASGGGLRPRSLRRSTRARPTPVVQSRMMKTTSVTPIRRVPVRHESSERGGGSRAGPFLVFSDHVDTPNGLRIAPRLPAQRRRAGGLVPRPPPRRRGGSFPHRLSPHVIHASSLRAVSRQCTRSARGDRDRNAAGVLHGRGRTQASCHGVELAL